MTISSSIIFSNISDHLPCIANLCISEYTKQQQKYVKTRVINDTAINSFRDELSDIDISSLLNANLATDPNTDYEKFENIITKTYDRHFPEKCVKFNKYKHKRSNWITSGILKSIEFRDKLYKRLKMCSPENSEYELLKYNLKIYNGYLNRCIRTAKKEFYHNEFNKYKNDIRKTWDTLKEIINKKTFKSDFPSCFVHEGVEITDTKNIADKFNEYFTEIGPKLAKSINTANKAPFNSYLTTHCPASFNFSYTKPDDIEKIIRNLRPKSSAGCDNISTKLLKEIENVVSRPLSIIINQSLCTGIFPDKLKKAKVIPLYKKDDNKLFGNYRPISLLSSISKIFERVAFNQLYDYFSSNGLLYESQYGFRKLHSTELAALEFTDRISQEMDAKKIPFSIFLDLSKAFDTLDHNVLLSKLNYYGIKDTALDWFKSYLTNRTQYVDCNGISSSIREIETGVPQGSILGPLLFIIYMNDIHTVSDNLNFILYADDTTLSSPMCSFTRGCDGNIDIVSTLINSELNKIADWLAVNKLSLNVQKTKFMIFHYRQRVLTENDIPCLMINNTLIERVTEFNFLGLTVNEYMNWNSHTQKIANKISRTLGVMNRLKRYLPISAMKLMYDSLILSHLQFGITSWGFEWDRISKLQKRALRIMTNSKYNAHTDPLFKRLHLLKVNDIFDVQCLKFWYKFVNKKLPNYFRDMFKYNYELHEIGTRSHDQLHLYPTRTSGARNVLRHHIPELLNKFPKYLTERIKTHSLYSIFYNIKCYLIDLYNYNCTIIDCYICNNNNWVTNRLSGNLGPAAGPWSQAAARVVDMTASGVGGDLRMVTGF